MLNRALGSGRFGVAGAVRVSCLGVISVLR